MEYTRVIVVLILGLFIVYMNRTIQTQGREGMETTTPLHTTKSTPEDLLGSK